ncbi:unnamed protein product [Ectocarpus sp. 12 AP-2014]
MASIVPDGKDPGDVVLECCLEGVESASQARSGGAHRIELCANLAQGGVTPSAGDIEGALLAVRGSRTRVHVLIRPRPGDFVYSVLEKQVMEKDVSAAVKAGAHGVVIGALLEDGNIDLETTERLVQVAKAAAKAACSITFHRAFDCCTTDEVAAMESLLAGVLLLNVQHHSASWYRRRVMVPGVVSVAVAGAGITHGNVKQLLLHTGAKEVHVGSACQENVPTTALREDATVCLGFVGEGSAAAGLKRVSAGRVSEMLTILAEGMS